MVAGEIEKYCSDEQIKRLQKLAITEDQTADKEYNLGEDTTQEETESSSAMITTDPKCDYICGSKGAAEDLKRMRDNYEIISTQGVDYAIVTEAQKEHQEQTIDKRNQLSYMSVNTVDEGIEWYRTNFPKVPEELLPMMARWNFGDLREVTKKDVKNDKKRVNQGKKPKVCNTLEVKHGNFVVKF